MKVKANLLIWMLLLTFINTASAEEGSLEVRSEVFKIEMFKDKAGKLKKRYIPAHNASVLPQDQLLYVNTIKNISEKGVNNIIINNPIAKQLTYIQDSARGTDSDITFSIDGGKTFLPEPQLLVTTTSGKRAATPDEYQAIQWHYLPELQPDQHIVLSFMAKMGRQSDKNEGIQK